jgi:hypothetical protein
MTLGSPAQKPIIKRLFRSGALDPLGKGTN